MIIVFMRLENKYWYIKLSKFWLDIDLKEVEYIFIYFFCVMMYIFWICVVVKVCFYWKIYIYNVGFLLIMGSS